MPSEQVTISLISGFSGIMIAYITTVLANKYKDKRASKQPKDRMEQMFDGYERLINQKDIEDQRKASIIRALQEDIDKLEDELQSTRNRLNETNDELIRSKLENDNLKKMLKEMREEYKKSKQQEVVISR